MSYLNDKKIDDNEVIKTTNSPQLLRLEKMIEAEANVVNELYYQIGKKYYQKFSDTNDPDFVNMVSSIKSSHDKIENLLEQKRLIKGVVRCVKCGAELDNGAVFCISCGTKQDEFKKPEPVETVALFCEKCSAPLRKGSAFCSKCGTKVEAVKHVEKPTESPVAKPAAAVAPAPVVQPQPKAEEKDLVPEEEPIVNKRVCSVCNSEMGDNIFCTKCGAKFREDGVSETESVAKENIVSSVNVPKIDKEETEAIPVPKPAPIPAPIPTPIPAPIPAPIPEPIPVVKKQTPPQLENDENLTVAVDDEEWTIPTPQKPPVQATSNKRICKKCGADLGQNVFCTRCGTRYEQSPSVATPKTPQTPPVSNKRICKKCGADLGENIFCTRCGTKYEQEKNVAAPKMPQTPPISNKRICKKCGADLGSNVFCTRCGTKYEASNNAPASNRPQINGSKSMIDGQPIAHAGAGASKKRYCPVCHGEVIGNTLYCTKCGAKL